MTWLLYVTALCGSSISAAAILPADRQSPPGTLTAEVDLVELNHFLDENGREVFRQVVFFDWSQTHRRFEVRAWRLIKSPSQMPRRLPGTRNYVVRWQDKSVTREVLAKVMRETWSQEDPERVNRALLPENERRPLWAD